MDPSRSSWARLKTDVDGHLDPSGVTTHAYAKSARKLGARL